MEKYMTLQSWVVSKIDAIDKRRKKPDLRVRRDASEIRRNAGGAPHYSLSRPSGQLFCVPPSPGNTIDVDPEGSLVFGQVRLSEMITENFRVWARNFFGFGHGRAASFPTCPA